MALRLGLRCRESSQIVDVGQRTSTRSSCSWGGILNRSLPQKVSISFILFFAFRWNRINCWCKEARCSWCLRWTDGLWFLLRLKQQLRWLYYLRVIRRREDLISRLYRKGLRLPGALGQHWWIEVRFEDRLSHRRQFEPVFWEVLRGRYYVTRPAACWVVYTDSLAFRS